MVDLHDYSGVHIRAEVTINVEVNDYGEVVGSSAVIDRCLFAYLT